MVTGLIAATDPVVGFALASMMERQGPWAPETDGQSSLEPFVRMVGRAMLRMPRPELPDAYRRLLASSVSGVAGHLLEAQDEHEFKTKQQASSTARLYWTDLHIATAYRANSVFFGQGRVTAIGDEEHDEDAWRAASLRLRQHLDEVAWLEACDVVVEFHERGRPDGREQEAAVRQLIEVLPASARELSATSVAALYKDLYRRMELGRANGWVAPPSSLATSADEMESWLASIPGVATLSCTGLGYWYLIFPGQDGKLVGLQLSQESQHADDDDEGEGDTEDLDWLNRDLNCYAQL